MIRWLLLFCLVVPGLTAGEAPFFTVLTWNVFHDPAHRNERVPAIMAEIHRLKPDLIALQEVAPWMREEIQRNPAFRDYRLTVIGNQVAAPGGVFLASRTGIRDPRIIVIPSNLDRCALVAEIDMPGGPLRVATVHLESFLEDGAIRAAQLKAVGQELAGTEEALLLGDCNFGDDEQPDTAAIPDGFADLWKQLKAADPGFTWDRSRNPSADAGSFPGETSRRLDRIFLKSKLWQPAQMELVGVKPVAQGSDIHPSDHFGLWVRLVSAAKK